MSLTKKIFTAMALGILFGSLANIVAPLPYQSVIENIVFFGLFDLIGTIFIASLKLLVVPMVFISLTCGAASLGGHSNMGVMAGKTISLYLMTTAIAISIALSLALLIEPGKQGGFSVQAVNESAYQVAPAPPLFFAARKKRCRTASTFGSTSLAIIPSAQYPSRCIT